MRRIWLTLGLMLIACANPGAAFAQGYPNKTVRIVVPYAPGGGVSVLAQVVGNKLSELFKQPVVIDNRPGAGGNLGADAVAKSPPDGYTILLHTSAMASAGSLYRKLPFDLAKDFVPVTMVIATQFVVAGSPKNPAESLRELVALAKAKPNSLNYGSSGPGSSLQLEAELFKHITGTDFVHIPYRGDAPMITALIGGDIQLAFLPQVTGITNVQANLIRGYGVTGTKRMTSLPNLPTLLEQGFSGMEGGSWNAMFVAGGTPPDIVLAIQQAVAKALADPKVRELIVATGAEPGGNTPAEFAAQFKKDIAEFARVIEQAKIPKLD